MRPIVIGLVSFLVLIPTVARGETIWWEAENPAATDFPATHPFEPQGDVQTEMLSQGKWIGADGKRDHSLFLEYDVNVSKEAIYNFYSRKFWKHGPFRWRFDDQPWQTCGKEIALLDTIELRKFLCANWVSLGDAKLSAGAHKLRIELLENDGAACFDCFVLTDGPFVANGKLKPGEKLNRAPEGWFAFEPDADDFHDSPIDLRYLNEKTAGENGHIRVAGDSFVHEKTKEPVRFWAVNAGPDVVRMDKVSAASLARWLAKRGVNMVRIHGSPWKEHDFTQIDEDYRDKLFTFIAAMKAEGIYTSLSIYFPLWLHPTEQQLEGFHYQTPFSVLFFSEKFQSIYRDWWKSVLTTKNPYTNLTLAEDPAVAFAEIVNEDSYFFWTFNRPGLPAKQLDMLNAKFKAWSKTNDDIVIDWWKVISEKTPQGKSTVAFLAEEQKKFFESMRDYLKNDLKFAGLVYGSNWITADERILGPIDKYTNLTCDFMDRHGYFSGPHEGERASYSLNKGDQYDDLSALLLNDSKSTGLPIMDLIYGGKPSTITEINWPPPNRFRADFPLLAGAYGALQGSDGIFFFCLTGPGWQQTQSKFGLQTPVIFGQFPAAALVYRKGLVKTGPVVVDCQLKLSDLLDLKGAPIAAPQNLDALRAADMPAGQSVATPKVESIDPLAYLVGRVQVNISEAGGESKVMPLKSFIDRQAKTVRSATGELKWDYRNGLVTVDAPAVRAASGFLAKAGPIDLGEITIDSKIEYGTIMLVALDDQPIATSKKILLQVMSEDTNFGWIAPGEGKRPIADVGGPPIIVKNFAGEISLKRTDAGKLKVRPLDFNGYVTEKSGSAEKITLAPSTMYYLIEK